MVFRSQIALITIPIALALSVIWFRRKKVHSDTGGSKSAGATKLAATANNNSNTDDIPTDQTQSVRVPIEHSPAKPKVTPPSKQFGKSAPIDITPHKTSPKRTASTTAAAPDAKADDAKAADGKPLNSIEESDSSCASEPDLPGSSNCRRRFSYTIRTNEPRVVVKATHMDARALNKSPQSSFEQLTSPSDNERTLDAAMVKPKAADKKPMADVVEVNGAEAKPSGRVLPVSSPPLSLCSNKSNRSQESGDSGKGGSISSPSNSEKGATLESAVQTFDFQLPQGLVKFLVGKNGVTVRRIRDQAKVLVHIRRHPVNPSKYKWCTVEGTAKQIEDALAIIKAKLPPKSKIEKIDIELEMSTAHAANQLDSNMLQQLQLIEGINNDIVISSVVSAGHMFVQQPFHPSYPSLNYLQQNLNDFYLGRESPMLPEYQDNAICVGPIESHWYRLQLIQQNVEAKTCVAKYLDFGGYCEIATSELRQIRFDCVSLPFQAIECYLADIKPIGDEWSIEAAQLVIELTQSRALQAQVVGYTDAGIPEIYLYVTLDANNFVFVNKELVARKYAAWVHPV